MTIMNKVKVCDDISPLAVFLVKSDSKQERLLFRYPYWKDDVKESSSRSLNSSYGLIISEDPLNAPRCSHTSELLNEHKLSGYPDKVLSNLFAVKISLCGRKFECKVNDVRFVGHPTPLSADTTSTFMFNIVFALKANASHDVVNCYHDFTHRLAIALQHEENRCKYLSEQGRIMTEAHDEVTTMPESERESPHHLILSRCQLARDLKRAFDDLTSSGIVHLQIQKWIEVSFCLPHKVHSVHNNNIITIGPEAIQSCLNALRPYHGFLLLVEVCDLLDCLPQDASPALIRLVQVASPLKSLQQLSADADLTLAQVFQLVGHLIYWAKATVIYPLCENNVYIVSPNADTALNSSLGDAFAEKFPGSSLLATLSQFSLPISLNQFAHPLDLTLQQVQNIKMVVWMLQHRLLMQLHTYLYLVPTVQSLSPLAATSNNPKRPVFDPSELGSSVSSDEFFGSILNPSDGMGESVSTTRSASPPDTTILMHLSPAEREAVKKNYASCDSEDLRLFGRLSKYFKGEHHLEEIMYFENVRRSQLMTLLDKFRDIVITCQHEDRASAAFYKKRKL